jgi:thiamine monophosphate kinase
MSKSELKTSAWASGLDSVDAAFGVAVGGGLVEVGARLEVPSAVFGYIEAFYNRRRRHSTLGMLITNHLRTATTLVALRLETNRRNNKNQDQQHQPPGVTQTGGSEHR